MGVAGLPGDLVEKVLHVLDNSSGGFDGADEEERETNAAERLAAHFKAEVDGCGRCGLSKGRNKIVYGAGNPEARLLFIGEGPGADEDRLGEPFVGRAGKLLDKMIKQMGLSREEIYIANIVKCRPPRNRNPLEDEVGACLPYLERQISIVAPDVIVTLGNVATKALLKTSVSISMLRGTFLDYRGIPVMPTFHPRFLLSNPDERWLVWEDMVKVLEKLSLPVPILKRKRKSEKS